jgi:hypothetical protein
MSVRFRCLIVMGVAAGIVGMSRSAPAQLDHLPYMLKYNRGQNIQPIFQGWSRNPDGSFEMHLGYLNRNYVEELHIPIGPDNHIEPGGPDRGQPTYFHTRVNRQIFSVTVPADWGDKELVWTVTVRGKTERTVGWLQPEWEIDTITRGRTLSDEAARNRPPTLAVEAAHTVTLPGTLTLTATASDDGLPTPRAQAQRPRAIGQETPPLLKPAPGSVPAGPRGVGGVVSGLARSGRGQVRARLRRGDGWHGRHDGDLPDPRNVRAAGSCHGRAYRLLFRRQSQR